MDALVKKMNALCDALPFQTSWYVKDLKTGKRRNLGTFKSRAAAEKHERAIQFFKRAA